MSYTADECRVFYRESKDKTEAVRILLDMNPFCTRRELGKVLGIDIPRYNGIFKPLKSPLEKGQIAKAIKTYKYQALAAKIAEKYGSFSNFSSNIGISQHTVRRFLLGKPCLPSTKDSVLDIMGMTEEEAQKEWTP